MVTRCCVLETRCNGRLLTGCALCQARVTVAEPLPLLKGRIRAPITCATPADAIAPATPKKDREHGRDREGEDAPELTHVVALKGQVLTWEVGLLNAGTPEPWQCLSPWVLLSDATAGAHHSECNAPAGALWLRSVLATEQHAECSSLKPSWSGGSSCVSRVAVFQEQP